MGKFIVRNGDLEGRKFRLESGAKVVLGRELGDLNFPDKRMSRRHCALESRDDGDYLVDMDSTNGCWVNNERIKEALLSPGDLLRVGFTELEFLGMPDPNLTAAMFAGLVAPGGGSPNQTIAFRRPPGLDAPAGVAEQDEAEPAAGDTTAAEPPSGSSGTAVTTKGDQAAAKAQRVREKDRVKAAKYAAMGKALKDDRRLISAKGKFCEACGEAIFMKEGAADEGVMANGLYLCRMCALIAEKQKGLGADYLPSYAKIVGGRMTEMPPDGHPVPGAPSVDPLPEPEGDFEIVESEEVSIDDLAPADSEKVPATAVEAASIEIREAPAGVSPIADLLIEGSPMSGLPSAGATSLDLAGDATDSDAKDSDAKTSNAQPSIVQPVDALPADDLPSITPLCENEEGPLEVAAGDGVADTHTDEPRRVEKTAAPAESASGTDELTDAATDALAAALEIALNEALAKEDLASEANAPQTRVEAGKPNEPEKAKAPAELAKAGESADDDDDDDDDDKSPIEELDPDDIVTPRQGEPPIMRPSSDEPDHASGVEEPGGRPPEGLS